MFKIIPINRETEKCARELLNTYSYAMMRSEIVSNGVEITVYAKEGNDNSGSDLYHAEMAFMINYYQEMDEDGHLIFRERIMRN